MGRYWWTTIFFFSPELAQIKLSQGVSFVHNTIAWKIWPTGIKDDRKTPYLLPHDTQIAGLHDCPCGNASYFNNLFIRADMTPYDECILPVRMEGNLYLAEAEPSKFETNGQRDTCYKEPFQVSKEDDGWYLSVRVSNTWQRNRLIKLNDLGKAQIPDQTFKREGIPASFNQDFFRQQAQDISSPRSCSVLTRRFTEN